ncbi:MAG: HNH endonuclease, partial [Armatimonadetes bacterium]|nr:HNH endonuclease [Armatimonadota bacterium]
LRDNHHCQYCGKPGNTIDHIVPKSLRGGDSWTNCVCSCIACNNRKNNRSLEDCGMKLQRKPKKPSYIPWILIKRDAMAVGWKKYLLYNISIEEFIE